MHQLAAHGAVRAWSQAYRDDGLVVINDDAVWSAFDNHCWPALYFVDADGIIRFTFG